MALGYTRDIGIQIKQKELTQMSYKRFVFAGMDSQVMRCPSQPK